MNDQVLALALHALLDQAGVDRSNRAEGKASRVHTPLERVMCLVADRDRAVTNLEIMRSSHKAVVARAASLTDQLEAFKAAG